jgi:MerR family copper efflux transcriptional regulator
VKVLSIKEFSEQVGFSVRMLRYLEEVGLITPKRDHNNYRVYTQEQIHFAQRVKKFQNLGLQLKEIERLKNQGEKEQIELLKNVLKREQEIAEMKSETIPELKNLIDFSLRCQGSIETYFEKIQKRPKKLKTLGEGEKFNRTAYSIPILRNIYEDHLTIDANIELVATDLMKFSEWFEGCDYIPNVFSVLRESSFVFGKNINETFISGYEKAWRRFLPDMGFQAMEDFTKNDVSQLMGPHDIVIKSTFFYKDTGLEGEIIIPYSPIYTMSQLSHKN